MRPFVPLQAPSKQTLFALLPVPATPTPAEGGQSVEQAIANLQSGMNAALVSPPGGPGNIVVLGADGVSMTDAGLSFGTDPDQIPNAAQISGMISEEIINAPTLPSVAAATTANLAALSGTPTIDGVALTVGTFVLVKNQTQQHLNGVYQVAAGAWTRCYYTGSAWATVTAAQTTFDDLAIDLGIIQVNSGTQNGSVSYRCAVSDTSALLTATTETVIFSKTTLSPVADACNRYVSINNGNDTNNNGTLAFAYQTIGKALAGMSFPGIIKIAASGGAYAEAVAIPAAATNIGFESAQSATRGGMVRWTASWAITYPAGAAYHTYRGITWATASANPFATTGGAGAQSIWMENCAFVGSMSDITPTPVNFVGTLTLSNIDMTSAPGASVVVRANGGTYNFLSQTSPLVLSLAATVTGAGATINIGAGCNPGNVWVPLTFKGTVNRFQPAPGNVVGVLTSQAQLDTLLANTAAVTTGFYLISGFTPTQNAALAGAIIGHFATGTAVANWWERDFTDAPATISDASGQIYGKTAAPTYWQVLAVQTPVYGEVVLADGVTNVGTAMQTILTLNIPSAGTWRIDYVVRTNIEGVNTGSGTLAALYDPSGNIVPNAAVTVGFINATGTSGQNTAGTWKVVQTTGPAAYTLRARTWVAGKSNVFSDNVGQTKIGYQKIG